MDEYENDYIERIHNGELLSRDSIKVDDDLKYKTPKGKIVYGGGGIIPDVFVPIDTVSNFNSGMLLYLNEFSFKYIDNHRATMSKLTLDEFVNSFDKDNKIMKAYIFPKITPG